MDRGCRCVIILLFFVGLFISCDKEVQYKEIIDSDNVQLFEQINSQHSGINFNNSLTENFDTRENFSRFDYFFNGAGVGIADINNDGLQDIFFCGNQSQNKLYLNKGNFQFEDISKKAGINKNKQWSNGVTFADVNNDGYLDIYVSQGGPFQAPRRGNLLFINNKDLTFSEQASIYGLSDVGISMQSAFLDYDNDGDLDCFVMNESNIYGATAMQYYQHFMKNPQAIPLSSNHLYRNDNGKYTDVTRPAGLLWTGYGLGLVVSDINEDGWLDIYVANDYFVPDVMWINQKNGTFKDEIKERTKQISYFGMGADMGDINGDVHQDLFVLDMSSFDHYRSKTLMESMDTRGFSFLTDRLQFQNQYMFNTLQINNGQNEYLNVAHMAGLASTEWSWAGLIVDVDNDTHNDLYVTNGFRRYAKDNDSRLRYDSLYAIYGDEIPLQVRLDHYSKMPSIKMPNMIYKNHTALKFVDKAEEWGMGQSSFSNGAAYGDLDNDGDLDFVVNNIDDLAFLYKNNTVELSTGNYLNIKLEGDNSEDYAVATIHVNGKKYSKDLKRVRGYLSAMENSIHFGLGDAAKVDTLHVRWLNNKSNLMTNVKANQSITIKKSKAKSGYQIKKTRSDVLAKKIEIEDLGISFKHEENKFDDFAKEVLLPQKQSTLGPVIVRQDINGDGEEDLFVGGAKDQTASLFLQKGGKFVRTSQPAFSKDNSHEDLGAVFFDLDGDNDLDLYVSSGGNEEQPGSDYYLDRLYLNDGSGIFSRHPSFTDRLKVSGKGVYALDFDSDGDQDLFVANRIRPQNYPVPAPSILYENKNGKLIDRSKDILPNGGNLGIVNEVEITDFNNDNKSDLVIVGEWSHVQMLENQGGSFVDKSKEMGIDHLKGWFYSVKGLDLNNDGLKDFVVGNLGTNSKFKASEKKPFKVYANDFDKNGTLDIVLAKKYKDRYVPVRGKECSTQQMPFISEKFPTYHSFASADIFEIYGENNIEDSYAFTVNTFESVVLIQKSDGRFDVVKLPVEAQMFPILDIEVRDLNSDGNEDLILAGNIFNTEVETPRYDAGDGLILINANGKLNPVLAVESGLYLKGNVKSISILEIENVPHLIAGNNDAALELFRLKISS